VQSTLEGLLQPLNGDDADSKIDIRVCGRTDAGVSALGQVCRVRMHRHVTRGMIQKHPNEATESLLCVHVQHVSYRFHPTFGCTLRAYAYILDPGMLTIEQVASLNKLLSELENQELDYISMSYGKVKTQSTCCTLLLARASLVGASTGDDGAVCIIRLVGDRFLRRMVRILVATAIREVVARRHQSSLKSILQTKNRTLAARPAPPDGLLFVAAAFDRCW